jgi:hypothetical protein
MPNQPRPDEEHIPEFQDPRDVAHDDPNYRPGADAEPDQSEGERGGDQDIDTAGQVPGEMATDIDDATGF